MSLLLELVQKSLEDLKGQDIQVIDLKGKSTLADYMVVVSGTSNRHLKALADKVYLDVKTAGYPILGVEGEKSSEWVLVDLDEVIVHIMHPETRENYALEKLWSVGTNRT